MLEVSDVSLLKEEIRQLKELLAEKDETIRQLRENLRPEGWSPPIELGLGIPESQILALLYKNKEETVTKEQLYQALYQGNLNPPLIKTIDVFICKLRNKIKKYDMIIETVWGRGYLLPKDSALILDNWGKEILSS